MDSKMNASVGGARGKDAGTGFWLQMAETGFWLRRRTARDAGRRGCARRALGRVLPQRLCFGRDIPRAPLDSRSAAATTDRCDARRCLGRAKAAAVVDRFARRLPRRALVDAAMYAGHAENLPTPSRPPYEPPLDIIELSKDAPPEKSRLTMRLWRFPVPLSEYHTYIAGSVDYGGLTPRLPVTLPYEPEATTLSRLRIPIEVVNVRGMLRRTSLFQELLAVMLELKNPHDYPPALALSYRFGVWPSDDYEAYDPGTTPRIIPKEAEDDLVSKWITDPLTMDLILVPQTQVDAGDVCTLVRCAGDEEAKETHDVLSR